MTDPRLAASEDYAALLSMATLEPVDIEVAAAWFDTHASNDFLGALDEEWDDERRADARAEMRRMQAAASEEMDGFTTLVYAGTLTLAAWSLATGQVLQAAHLTQALLGARGRPNAGPDLLARVGLVLLDEYGFLINMALDIEDGRLSEAQGRARSRLYGQATQQSYWRETVHASGVAEMNWTLHPAEHCDDCLTLAAGSPYRVDALPTVPGAGDTECLSNCKCTLDPVGAGIGRTTSVGSFGTP